MEITFYNYGAREVQKSTKKFLRVWYFSVLVKLTSIALEDI